jgi:hypothetical protein
MIRVLARESPDKKTQEIYEIAPAELAELIKEDYGFHEIIPMIEHTTLVRLFFDVDVDLSNAPISDPIAVLDTILTLLNAHFGVTDDDWAIAVCNRNQKASYHIIARHLSICLTDLRRIVKAINCPYLDESVYYFPLWNHHDEGSLRLPNQSKGGINKEGPPLMVVQGDLSDFFVTQTAGCHLWTPESLVETKAAADTIPNSH